MSEYAAVVGWDWADKEHELDLREHGATKVEVRGLGARPQDLHAWAAEMLERFGGRPIAVAIDAGRGAVISAFMHYPHIVLYPINPKSAARAREAFYPSGKKDDPVDGQVLRELIEKHRANFRPLQPADPQTRELGLLSEHRRKLDNDRKRELNRLRDTLKTYYPQVLDLFEDLSSVMVCDFLAKWPSLDALQRARTTTIEAFFRDHGSRSQKIIDQRLAIIRSAVALTNDPALMRAGVAIVQSLAKIIRTFMEAIRELEDQLDQVYRAHPDHDLFDSFLGIGGIMGPRLIAFFGTDRDRWESAEAMQMLSGVAPVTMRTGGKNGPITIHRRIRRPKFHHQTFVESAGCSLMQSEWARAYYDMMRERHPTMSHHAILRSLAFKWLRIYFHCWKERVKYDEAIHQAELIRTGSPVGKKLLERRAA